MCACGSIKASKQIKSKKYRGCGGRSVWRILAGNIKNGANKLFCSVT